MTQLNELDLSYLADIFGIDEEELEDICERAISSGKHNEFFSMTKELFLPTTEVCSTVCRWLLDALPDQFNDLINIVSTNLD